MKAGNNNIIERKAFDFSLEIIKLYKYLVGEKKEYILSKQLPRSGGSIGANINEARAGKSKKDVVHKFGISQKETRENLYWLNLLLHGEYISYEVFNHLNQLCNELNKMLTSIIVTTKQKIQVVSSES